MEAADNWMDDPYAYDQAIHAAATILLGARPKGDPNPRRFDDEHLDELAPVFGQMFANRILDYIIDPDLQADQQVRAGQIRDLLGDVAKRIARPERDIRIGIREDKP